VSAIQARDLLGVELNRWVAKAEGKGTPADFSASTDWAQGGPIIEREGIHIAPMPAKGSTWCAIAVGRLPVRASGGTGGGWIEGPTPLAAAMRAYVVSRFGYDLE
jgi:hypothetical protein